MNDKPEELPEKYEDVVGRLQSVVERLEAGELSLEDSLSAFEEGVRLVNRGERLLADAEHRVEELLSRGGEDRADPLAEGQGARTGPSDGGSRGGRSAKQPQPDAGSTSSSRPPGALPDAEDDIPF